MAKKVSNPYNLPCATRSAILPTLESPWVRLHKRDIHPLDSQIRSALCFGTDVEGIGPRRVEDRGTLQIRQRRYTPVRSCEEMPGVSDRVEQRGLSVLKDLLERRGCVRVGIDSGDRISG